MFITIINLINIETVLAIFSSKDKMH